MSKLTKRVRKANGTPTKRKRRFKPIEERWAPKPGEPKAMVKARQHLILEMYAAGKTPDQIALKMNMRRQHVTRDLNIAIQEMIEAFSKPTPQQTFVRYAAFQLSVVRKLGDLIHACKKEGKQKQYTAWVTALRAQSDIYDKVYSKGREYGVIQQDKADPKSMGATADIRAELRTEILSLTALLDHIDDQTQREGLKGRAIRSSVTYAVRVRVPLRTAYGIARAIPDWKYRTKLYDKHGAEIPKSKRTPEQELMLNPPDPDHRLHLELAKHEQPDSDPSPPMSPTNPPPKPVEESTSTPQAGRAHAPPKQDEGATWLVKPTR